MRHLETIQFPNREHELDDILIRFTGKLLKKNTTTNVLLTLVARYSATPFGSDGVLEYHGCGCAAHWANEALELPQLDGHESDRRWSLTTTR
jgi:hypothetical protein